MSVLIRDIDKELYKQFKAKAVMQGIKVGTALTLAMEKWLKEDEDLPNLMRAKNKDTLKSIRNRMMTEHAGKWLLISDGDLMGIYETKQQVLEAIKEKHLVTKNNLISHLQDNPERTVRLGIRRRQY
ncbi:MAG: hypothetical protein INQ03_10480 [Candidatus Heimdallarchaeota archaeon]|nr:hypothetical protein [Candidatus Heimdallarchaeota archaeon]